MQNFYFRRQTDSTLSLQTKMTYCVILKTDLDFRTIQLLILDLTRLGLDDLSLAWPTVVQLVVSF